MKAVWFPKVLASPNSQQNSPKHRHREPLTLGHRSSKGPMFRWKSASEQEAPNPKDSALRQRIKGPDNPTSQLLPILSFKGCSGDGEGRKDKGGGEGSTR